MVWQGAEICEEGGGGERGIPQHKRKESCCNSPVVRRVPKNADSICKQLNREDSQIQDFSFVNFERSTEALCADSW